MLHMLKLDTNYGFHELFLNYYMFYLNIKSNNDKNIRSTTKNSIGGVLVSMLVSSAIGRGSSIGRVKPKTMIWVFVVSPLNMQH